MEPPRPNTNRHVHAHKCLHCAGIDLLRSRRVFPQLRQIGRQCNIPTPSTALGKRVTKLGLQACFLMHLRTSPTQYQYCEWVTVIDCYVATSFLRSISVCIVLNQFEIEWCNDECLFGDLEGNTLTCNLNDDGMM
jgi:hypothetical protein